jgi:hypothetical protein
MGQPTSRGRYLVSLFRGDPFFFFCERRTREREGGRAVGGWEGEREARWWLEKSSM